MQPQACDPSKNMKYRLGSLLLLVIGSELQANELYGSWYWHAFASQTVIHTTDNNFAGKSDDNLSADSRELGLLIGGAPLPNLSLAGQLLSRNAGAIDDGRIRLDYGYANYTLYSGLNWMTSIRGGRVRTPYGFYNETRDVAHTRTSILLPQGVYVDRFRNLDFTRDGLQWLGNYQFDMSSLSWDVAVGEIRIKEKDASEVVQDPDGKVTGSVDTPWVPIARVIWDWDMGRIRLGLTYNPLEYRYSAAPLDSFNSGTLKIRNWVVSAEYNAANWSLIGEYNHEDMDMGALMGKAAPGVSFENQTRGYYLQGIYRFDLRWDAFLRYDTRRISFKEVSELDSSTKDITLGIGWKPDEHWLIRAEWHIVDGAYWLSVQENRAEDLKRHWQMALFQVSYRI